MVPAMCGILLKDRKGLRNFMQMEDLNEVIVGYVIKCSLIWLCDEEGGWSCLEKGIRVQCVRR